MAQTTTAVLTVETLAAAKGLDAQWLRERCGLKDAARGVTIPYWDSDRTFVAHKLRTDVAAKKGSLWARGKPLSPYGLWRPVPVADGWLLVVEGESNCWALWSAGLPALGLPGSDSAGCLTLEAIADVATIYVHRDPDQGGAHFVAGVQARLAKLGWQGRLLEWDSGPGVKDPCDLRKAAPRLFTEAVRVQLDQARTVEATPAKERNGTHAEPKAGWEPPVPIDTLPEPAPFPLDALPAPIAEYVTQCAWATNSPVDFVAVPLLAIAAGCIGASRRIAIQKDHLQPATIFAAVIGAPGTGKSPALEKVADPLEEQERKNGDRHRRLVKEWQEEDPETRKERPELKRLLVDNTTTEGLCKTLHANQRGLIMLADELSGLVASLNQYKDGGKGNDRQVYQQMWASRTIRIDRKSNVDALPLVVRSPSLSIAGGLNPDLIESFLTDPHGKRVDDGFFDRFVTGYPKPLRAIEEQRRAIEPGALTVWSDAVAWLLSLEQWKEPDGLRPKIIGLTGDGWEAWVDFTRAHAAEVNAGDFPSHRNGPWSKLRGYCGRLALVSRLLEMAASGETGPEDVDALAVNRAAALTAYFKSHHLRVAAVIRSDPRLDEAARVIGWLERNPAISEFSRRDAYKDLTHSFKAPDGLDAPCSLLEQYGYIRAIDREAKQGPGRKPTARYDVNPLWKRR